MSEIFNLSALCRCCHSDGSFKSLSLCYNYKGQIEIYANMLHETFGVFLKHPPIEASYSICDICIEKLRNALQFKKQIQECEMMFEDYCRNEMAIALQSEIRIEHELCSDKMTIKPAINIKVEDLSDDSEDIEYTNADIDVSNDDFYNEDETINTEYQQNNCIEKQESDTPYTDIERTGCLKKRKSGKTNSKKEKEIKQTSDVSNDDYNNEDDAINTEYQQNNCLEKQESDTPYTEIERTDCLEKGQIGKINFKKEKESLDKKQTSDVSNDDYNNEDETINIEYQQNNCLEKQVSGTPNTEIKRTDCFKKGQISKTNSRKERKSLDKKQTSHVSKVKIKQNGLKIEKLNTTSNPKSEHRKQNKNVTVETDNNAVTVCQTCNVSFKNKINLRDHVKKHHSTHIEYSCKICKKIFNTKEALETHTLTHICDGKYVCDLCSNSYRRISDVINHRNTHTKEKVFTCDICNKDFLFKYILIKHLAFHSGQNKKFMCDLCGHRFNDISNLNIHIRTVHEKLRLFKCDQCPKVYATSKTLRIHLRAHTGERPYKCILCGKYFPCSTSLSAHRRNIHAKSRLYYVCKVCGKQFNNRSSYASHTRSHTGAKPYKCQYCDKDFVCKYSQQYHIASHEGRTKIFPCEICDRSFTQKAVMIRHVKTIHDPNKPPKIKCTLCKISVSNMEKHMKVHTSRMLQCSYCLKSYSDTRALNRHVRQAHSGITHDCDLCDKKYIKRGSLRSHKLKKHNTPGK